MTSEKVVVIRRLKRRFSPLEVGIPVDESSLSKVENDIDEKTKKLEKTQEKLRKRKETKRNYCPDPNCRIHVRKKNENEKPSPSTSTTAEDASTAPVQEDG